MEELSPENRAIFETGEAVLYGAGQVGREACRVLTEHGIRVLCMLDRTASGQEEYLGVGIYNPALCPVEEPCRANIPLVITIFNRDVDVQALVSVLRPMGFGRVVSFLDLHSLFPSSFGDRFWLTRRSYFNAYTSEMAAAMELLADEASRSVYQALVAMRLSGRFDPAQNPTQEGVQYLPTDVPGWLAGRDLRFVDCGAYQGDTLAQMLGSGHKLDAAALFEPDLDNFKALARSLRTAGGVPGDVVLWPCAVGECTGEVRFLGGLGEGSAIRPDGDRRVTVVALDDALVEWQPTLVKLDIEGSELEALQGARKLIDRHRPSLAVCVYHRPDHLWQVPLALSEWTENRAYRFYLRSHGFNGFETVLYAQPEE